MKRNLYAVLTAPLIAASLAVPARAAIAISSGPTSNMTCSGGVCTPTAADAVLNVSDLENLLASGNVEVTTTGSGVQASDIQIVAPFSWSNASALSLDAYGSIIVTAQAAVAGSGGLSLTTNDGGSNGTLTFLSGGNITFATPTNALAINGTKYKLETTIRQLAYDIVAHPRHAFALANDIQANHHIFRSSPIPVDFAGSFNGLGHVISGLEIVDMADLAVGFFATMSAPANISGIGLANVHVVATYLAGGLVGSPGGAGGGTIANSWVSGDVRGEFAGGLIGANGGELGRGGTISNSWSSANVEGGSAGGLAGLNDGTIESSFATGAVKGLGGGGSGGLAGGSSGTITNAYATGDVADYPAYPVGGFVGGVNSGTISYAYAVGRVGSGGPAGGFIGNNAGAAASFCYWDTSRNKGLSGVGSGSGAGIQGLTSHKLRSKLPKGFDPAIWAEDPTINDGFPYLIANPPQ